MQNIIIIVAVAVMVVLIPVWIGLSSKAKKEEVAEYHRKKFVEECKAHDISSINNDGADELMRKYHIDSTTANSLLSGNLNGLTLNDSASTDILPNIITVLAWIVGVLSIIGWIVIGATFENFAIGLAGSIVSVVFMLVLLGLAKIVNYLYKIYRSTLIISSRLNQTSEK